MHDCTHTDADYRGIGRTHQPKHVELARVHIIVDNYGQFRRQAGQQSDDVFREMLRKPVAKATGEGADQRYGFGHPKRLGRGTFDQENIVAVRPEHRGIAVETIAQPTAFVTLAIE